MLVYFWIGVNESYLASFVYFAVAYAKVVVGTWQMMMTQWWNFIGLLATRYLHSPRTRSEHSELTE